VCPALPGGASENRRALAPAACHALLRVRGVRR
jgi:hypothetical protein